LVFSPRSSTCRSWRSRLPASRLCRPEK
jgi:hypothetical protein